MAANGTTTTAVVQREETPRVSAAIVRATIEPQTMAELKDFAKIAADSHFFGAETPQQALIIAMTGRDLGFSYTQALRAFHVIKGKPSLSADGMVAVCLQHREVCEFFRPVEQTTTRSTWETKRVGDTEVRRASFTIEDAKAAGLFENPGQMWRKYPQRMLSARAKAFLARDVYTELVMGLYDPDELGELPAPAPARVVESRALDSDRAFEVPTEAAPESDVDAIAKRIDDAQDETTLKAIGKTIVDAVLSDEQRKDLRAAYAKRRNKLAKLAREAAEHTPVEQPATDDSGDGYRADIE